jgi:integrase
MQRGSVRLRKRRGGKDVWTIRYRVRSADGWTEKVEAVPKAKNESDARKVLERRIWEVNTSNDPHRPRSIDLESFASGSDWQAYLDKRRVKPSTRNSYRSMLDKIVLPALGSQPIDDIASHDIARLLNSVEAGGKSGKYALNVYSMLRVMFAVAQELDLIDKSPIRPKLHRPTAETREKPTLAPEQIRKVEEAFPSDLRVLCLCVALTGLRLGELLALRWEDVDLEERVLRVTHSLWRGRLLEPKTAASKRKIRMSHKLAERLSEHRDGSKWAEADDFVFARDDGSPQDPDHLRRQVLYPAMKAAGITRVPRGHGFYIFRHSAASILYAERGDLKQTQEFLGHARIPTTADVYTHVDDKILEDGVEALADAIWPGPIEVEGSDRIQ